MGSRDTLRAPGTPGGPQGHPDGSRNTLTAPGTPRRLQGHPDGSRDTQMAPETPRWLQGPPEDFRITHLGQLLLALPADHREPVLRRLHEQLRERPQKSPCQLLCNSADVCLGCRNLPRQVGPDRAAGRQLTNDNIRLLVENVLRLFGLFKELFTMDVRPNHTIYINNLNEKVKKEGERGLLGL